MSKDPLSPDAQAALDVCKSLLASMYIGGEEGRKQFEANLHPDGHMAHARYYRGKPIFFHRLPDLADFVGDAWCNPGTHNEVIDGEATVLLDHDMAVVWTPYWFRVNGELTHVGTNCFNLLKEYEGDGKSEGKWEWRIVVICDTGREVSEEDRKRLDGEYKKGSGDGK